MKAEAAAEPTKEESALEEPDEVGRTPGGMAFVSGGDSVLCRKMLRVILSIADWGGGCKRRDESPRAVGGLSQDGKLRGGLAVRAKRRRAFLEDQVPPGEAFLVQISSSCR